MFAYHTLFQAMFGTPPITATYLVVAGGGGGGSGANAGGGGGAGGLLTRTV